jgi:DNA-binding NarL/FixJ family response regulator
VGAGADLQEALGAMTAKSSTIDVLLVGAVSFEMFHARYWAVIRLALPPLARTVVLCRSEDSDYLETLFSFGVMGLLPADSEPERIAQAARSVARGEFDYDVSLPDRLKGILARPVSDGEIRIGDHVINRLTGKPHLPETPVRLTRREREVLRLVAAGLTNRQIAGKLEITERTAVFHVGNLLRKFGMASRVEIALLTRWFHE